MRIQFINMAIILTFALSWSAFAENQKQSSLDDQKKEKDCLKYTNIDDCRNDSKCTWECTANPEKSCGCIKKKSG